MLSFRRAALGVLLGLCGIVGLLAVRGHIRRAFRTTEPQRVAKQTASQAHSGRAFYFWKTQWTPSPALLQILHEHEIARLYVRFFDVDWEESVSSAQPVSPLRLGAPLPTAVTIIPVVFVTNRVFLNTKPSDVGKLADQVLHKVEQMAAEDGVRLTELQLDCDWTERTRASYFRFLEIIGRNLHKQKQTLSSTIRLHQIKYPERTGVPPVDRGMLMLYNFGPLRADAIRSSIFNVEDAERYTAHIASYVLPLDVALPVFSWTVHSRDGAVLGLLEKLESADIDGSGAFELKPSGRYQATRSLFFRGRYVMEGDELLIEQTTPQVTRQAATVAMRGASEQKTYGTIALFDLDEKTLRHYDKRDLEEIFNAHN